MYFRKIHCWSAKCCACGQERNRKMYKNVLYQVHIVCLIVQSRNYISVELIHNVCLIDVHVKLQIQLALIQINNIEKTHQKESKKKNTENELPPFMKNL